MTGETVLSVENLTKEYRTHFRRKRVRAVVDATLAVERGEIFGFVGPNGAGKTTTIRTILGLIRPTAGRCLVFGKKVPSPEARARVGFLPEAPYFYDYLTARELCDLAGRLFGLDTATRRRRAGELLERVGLAKDADRSLRKYSKGMLQRAGLAQALMSDPELLILDEPMSGLDPIGRKEVRDLIVGLQEAGKTIFFSTHILPDVEAICDRVAIISGGRVQETGTLAGLLDSSQTGSDVVVRLSPGATLDGQLPPGAAVRKSGDAGDMIVFLPEGTDVNAALARMLEVARVVSVTPRRASLEDVFVRMTREPS